MRQETSENSEVTLLGQNDKSARQNVELISLDNKYQNDSLGKGNVLQHQLT